MEHLCVPLEWNPRWHYLQSIGEVLRRSLKPLHDHTRFGHRTVGAQTKFPDPVYALFPGLTIHAMVVFQAAADSIGVIHTDGATGGGERQVAINIPLLDCHRGEMQWFNVRHKGFADTSNQGRSVRSWPDHKDEEPIHRMTIDRPSVVRIDHPHRIDNRGNPNIRWMLSFRFLKNPTYQQVLELARAL